MEEVKVEPVVEPTVEPVTPPVEDTKKVKTEVLRDLSKELGVNLFEAEGLQQVKTLIDSQKTEQQKLQEQLQAYESEKAQWESKRLEYESKLKASELGIAPDNMEDALKLADNDPSKLQDVIKKYPFLKSKEGVRIGVQDPQHTTPTGNTEAEEYIARNYANNKAYAKYLPPKK